MIKIRCDDILKLDSLIEANIDNQPLFCLFMGSNVPEKMNQSWCGDCRDAQPILEEAFLDYGEACTLIEVSCTKQEYYKNPEYYLRQHEAVKLNGIPTLLRWTKSGAADRLGEEGCKSKEKIEEFLNSK